MTAEIYQFVPRPNPNREKQLEALAVELMNAVFPPEPDTAPSEWSPGQDSA